MAHVVVADDGNVEVFGEEEGKVLVVAGEVLGVTMREEDDRFYVLGGNSITFKTGPKRTYV